MFYNPRMELCRDIDIAAVAVFVSSLPDCSRMNYIDALGGTGVRGVRVANEVGLQVTINDRSTPAYQLIKRNIALNKVEERTEVHNGDANVLLVRTPYDLVDIDPFGSSVPFLDAACKSVKEVLLVTATDTAPLCGAHTGGVRNYGAQPLNTEYHAEMATRILLGTVTRELGKYDKAIQPLLSYASAHFIRLIARVEKGARKADESIERLGFIAHCFSCGHRFAFPCADMLNLDVKDTCALCGQQIRVAGPLYIHPIKEKEFCERVHMELGNRELGKKLEALKIVYTCIHELDIPFYYEHHALCKSLKLPSSPISSLIDALLSHGFSASRTHFSDTALKTDARIDELKTLVKTLST
jgi:tRNA (guanine26-N2/guanine27-N2)-dimethyltransferase